MKKFKWYYGVIIGVVFLALLGLSWSKGFDSGFDGGYNYGYNDSFNNHYEAFLNLSQGTINDSVNEMTLDFSNKCIKYFCENIFESNYIEGNSTTNYLGKCSGEEYKSVGALEECRKMFFGD